MKTIFINVDNIKLSEEIKKTISEQLSYVDSRIIDFSFIDDTSLELGVESVIEDQDHLINKVTSFIKTTIKSFRKSSITVLFKNDVEVVNTKDPHEYLLASRQMVDIGTGDIVYQGELRSLMSALDSYFRDYALELGATEQDYPSTVPLSSMVDNGYVKSFPHHTLFATHLSNDLESINLASQMSKEEFNDSNCSCQIFAAPSSVLSPTVCYRLFEFLKGQTVDSDELLYTAVAKCHRNEGLTISGLTRLQTFTMREIVFYGDANYVEEMRLKIMNHAMDTIKEWGVNAKVQTASDPFFSTSDSRKKRAFQTLMNLKYEMQVFLPYSNKWISCMSFNNHQDSLVTKYNIKMSGIDKTVSGCVGYGYERLALALYAQFGVDFSLWPDVIRKDISL